MRAASRKDGDKGAQIYAYPAVAGGAAEASRLGQQSSSAVQGAATNGEILLASFPYSADASVCCSSFSQLSVGC